MSLIPYFFPQVFHTLLNGEVNTLLFFCAFSSVITTSVFFVEIYSTTVVSHQTVMSPISLNTVTVSAKLFVRKAVPAAAAPLDTLEIQQHPKLEHNSTYRNALLNTAMIRHVPKHSADSVFRSWNHGLITRSYPSLSQNCSALAAGNSSERRRVIKFLNQTSEVHTSLMNVSNCSQVLHEFYDNFYVSDREREFPIAFTLVVHTNPEQTLRFLKAIYRSQNMYCIHPDLNSGEEFVRIFKSLSKCLPNVFVPSVIGKVTYTNTKTILEAQMSCLRDLQLKYHRRKWRYVINLCSRELPLQTNRFIVEDLMAMKGASVLKAIPVDGYNLKTRFSRARHEIKTHCKKTDVKCVENTDEFLRENGIKLYKSMAYNALSFEFVHYLLHNKTMQKLTQWMIENCRIPEEHLYATAYMMPDAPGGFSHNISIALPKVSKSVWKHHKNSHYYSEGETCSGKSVHQVCILSSADLPLVRQVVGWGVWFLNKFFMEDDHIVMDCVEEMLVTSNRQEFYSDYGFRFSW